MESKTIKITYPNHAAIGENVSIDVPAKMLPALIEDQAVEQMAPDHYLFTKKGLDRIQEAEYPDWDMSLMLKKPR